MNYKNLETIKAVIGYPFRLIMLPVFIVSGFFITNWNEQWERDFYFTMIKKFAMLFPEKSKYKHNPDPTDFNN